LPIGLACALDPRVDAAAAERDVAGVLAAAVHGNDDFQRASSLESGLYMSNQLLRDSDNFSMASSIELRAPFLDHALFDAVYNLAAARKYDRSQAKSLLVDSLPEPLPAIVTGASKMGFTFPVELWFRKRLSVEFPEVMATAAVRELLDARLVEGLWRDFWRGKAHWSTVWSLYALGRWLNAHSA
jgi:asparagine synthase (glutamine-hydrolysing)